MTLFIGTHIEYMIWLQKEGKSLKGKQSINLSDRSDIYKIQDLELDEIIDTDCILMTFSDYQTIMVRYRRSEVRSSKVT